MAGYIGSTFSGITTTLGRGGSDYSAAIIGATMNAQEIQIWSDVDGVMTADPRIVPGAWKVKQLSFPEAAELAIFGAKVLHPKTVEPAIAKNIPVYVLNSRNSGGDGTLITNKDVPCRNVIKGIALKRDVTVITVTSSRMLGALGFLQSLFAILDKHGVSVDVVATSEISVSATLENKADIGKIKADLQALGDVSIEGGLALISVVGAGMKKSPGIISRVLGCLWDVEIMMISHGASNINIHVVVEGSEADRSINTLHDNLFVEFDSAVFEKP